MTFGNRVTSITQDTILPKVIDNILTDNLMAYRYISNGKKWSGETLKRPIKISKSTTGGSFSGLDTFSTATSDTRISLQYDLRGYYHTISIPGMEKAVNNVSETQVINLVRTELESAQMDMLDALGDIFYGDGTGNSNKNFNGLGNLDDDGSTAATVGGQSRTTYPTLAGTRTASGGTLTLAKLATLISATSAGSASSQRPTLIVSSEAEFDLYDSLLAPTVRANYDAQGGMFLTRTSKAAVPGSMLKANGGFVALTYRGIPWVSDEKASAQTIWVLNENYLEWYGLKDPDLKAISMGNTIEGPGAEIPSDNTGFQWTGFQRPVNQYGEVGQLMLLGNLATWQPRRHGRLTGVTGV